MNADTINKINPDNGRKTGYWIITGSMSKIQGYSSESKVEEGVYVNSRKNGLWIKYWPNGNVKSKILTSSKYLQMGLVQLFVS